MIRHAVLLAISLSASPALAEDIRVRSGEHPTYSRLVLWVGGGADFRLAQNGRSAVITFAGETRGFDFSDIFDRMPRTRILSAKSVARPEGTAVELSLNCECEVLATADSGKYVILDVRNGRASAPDAVPSANAAESHVEVPQAVAMNNETQHLEHADHATEPPEVQEAAHDEQVPASDDGHQIATAEVPPQASRQNEPGRAEIPLSDGMSMEDVRDMLLKQLNKAADEGLVDFVIPREPPETVPADPETDLALEVHGTEHEPQDQHGGELHPDPEDPGARHGSAESSAASHGQENAPAPVPRTRTPRKTSTLADSEVDPGPNCELAGSLDFGDWGGDAPFDQQLAALNTDLLGEFDRPNIEAVEEVVKLYLHYGFGAEARAFLNSLGMDLQDRDALLEIAHLVESENSPELPTIAGLTGCGGDADVLATIADPMAATPFSLENALDAFQEMPVQARRLLGPKLMTALAQRGDTERAESIYRFVNRAPGEMTPEMQLAYAALSQTRGDVDGAMAQYFELLKHDENSADAALLQLVEGFVSRQKRVPDDVLELVSGRSFAMRGSANSVPFIAAEIKALASTGDIKSAVGRAREAIARYPEGESQYSHAVREAFEIAATHRPRPEDVVLASYDSAELIGEEQSSFPARLIIAEAMTSSGLGNGALETLAPGLEAGDNEAFELAAARAYVAMGDGESALARIEGKEGPEIDDLRAQALLQSHRYAGAAQAIREAGGNEEDVRHAAWVGGVWNDQSLASNPVTADMSSFMRDREIGTGQPARESGKQAASEPEGLGELRAILDNSSALREMLKEEF